MLLVKEIVRDVLANEVIQLNKCIDALPPSTTCNDMRNHVKNMVDILMSDVDFKKVNNELQG